MSWTRGCGSYSYYLRINMESIAKAIIAELVDNKLATEADWELEGEDLIISGEGRCVYREWYCRATLEDPEEYELEMSDTIDEEDVSGIIKKAMDKVTSQEIDKALDITIDEESFAHDDYEPDPDMMPGGHDYDRGD